MSIINQNLQNAAASIRLTNVFLSEWKDRSDCKLLTRHETLSSDYMILKDGHLILWARTIGATKDQVIIHDRKELVTRMGETHVLGLEENLNTNWH